MTSRVHDVEYRWMGYTRSSLPITLSMTLLEVNIFHCWIVSNRKKYTKKPFWTYMLITEKKLGQKNIAFHMMSWKSKINNKNFKTSKMHIIFFSSQLDSIPLKIKSRPFWISEFLLHTTSRWPRESCHECLKGHTCHVILVANKFTNQRTVYLKANHFSVS